ncbi:hypothetical protein CYY_002011 [Polysphondylium violaceum]|uniref:Transmembrane protein n=1 Tax=Polysphondylium violaceum TaxID=133409 RepID=A0A8J4PXG3_9MYCE|nr:hypothetical protein CYY_002011 [Polysphondylium violaceum]
MKVLSILCLLLLISSVFSLSQEETKKIEGEISVGLKDGVFRSFSKLIYPNGFHYNGLSLNGTIFDKESKSDSIGFQFNKNSMNFMFKYSSMVKNDTDIDIEKYRMVYRPSIIIEYKETNDKEGFQYGEDQILGFVKLNKLDYTINEAKIEKTANNNQTFDVIVIDVTSSIFDMRFYLTGSPVSVAGNEISSSQSKIDIMIHNYYDETINVASKDCKFERFNCDSTGPSNVTESRLALASLFMSMEKDVDIDFDIDDNDVSLKEEEEKDVKFGFQWVSTCDVVREDGRLESKVHTSVNSTTDDFQITTIDSGFKASVLIHSFEGERALNVTWDPTLGVNADFEANSSIKLLTPTLLIVALILLSLL